MVAGGGFSDIQKALVETTREAIAGEKAAREHAAAMKVESAAAKETAKSLKFLEKAANARNKSIAKAMQIPGVTGTAGSNAFSKYKPKGFAGVSDKIASSNVVSGVYGKGGSEQFSGYKPRGFGNAAVDKAVQTSNRVAGVYGRGGTEVDSGYQPKGFTGKGKTADKVARLFGQFGNTGSKLEKMNKSFFKFQMATLGLAFSFGGLEGTVMGAISAIANLGGTFKSMALGKAFTGVDMATGSGTSNQAVVDAWKAFQGIMGLVATTMGIITANMLSPDLMTAIANFFTALAPVLPALGEALGSVATNSVEFLTALIPLVPIVAKIIDVFSPWLGVLVPIIFALGALLPLLSLLGYIFAAIEIIAPALALVLGGLSITMIAVGAAVVLVATFFYHLISNLLAGQGIIESVGAAFWQTCNDVWNAITWLISPLLQLAGIKTGATASPVSSVSTAHNTTQYNIGTVNLQSTNASAALNKNKA